MIRFNVPTSNARECVRWLSSTYPGAVGYYTPSRGYYGKIKVAGAHPGTTLANVALHAMLRWG